MIKPVFCAVLATLLMSGCAVYTPGVAVVTPAPAVVVVPAPGPGFCPPGQAKKGRC